jgi:hypothetical protein
MSDDKEYVYVELIFEDGKEMLQLPRRTFLKIQMKALEENKPFEDGKEMLQLPGRTFLKIQMKALEENKPFETKFLEILREEMEQENE